MPEAPSQEQVVEWASTLSNWGRWGPDDQLGTLNFITDETRQRAAAAVRTGEAVSCAWGIDPSLPALTGAAERFMIATGIEGVTNTPRATYANDVLQLQYHGSWVTHLDGLSHVAWDGRFYNDHPVDIVTASQGATKLGIETVGAGIITRGVLLDVAAVRGVPMLDFGDGAFPEDLEAAEERQGVRVEPGDAVLLSNGLSGYRMTHRNWTSADGASGFQAACLPWLRERQVSVIGCDGPNDTYPSGYPLVHNPIHVIGIPAMGLWLIDNCQLQTITELCTARQQWTFLLSAVPLPIVGFSGSPINPIAVL